MSPPLLDCSDTTRFTTPKKYLGYKMCYDPSYVDKKDWGYDIGACSFIGEAPYQKAGSSYQDAGWANAEYAGTSYGDGGTNCFKHLKKDKTPAWVIEARGGERHVREERIGRYAHCNFKRKLLHATKRAEGGDYLLERLLLDCEPRRRQEVARDR